MRLSALLLIAPLLVACGGEQSQADIPKIEHGIATGVRQQVHTRVTVDCPDQIEWKPGSDFHCFATDGQGRSSRVTVSMENDGGDWSWELG